MESCFIIVQIENAFRVFVAIAHMQGFEGIQIKAYRCDCKMSL